MSAAIAYEQKCHWQTGVREQIDIDSDIFSGRPAQWIAADYGMTVRSIQRRVAYLRGSGARVPEVQQHWEPDAVQARARNLSASRRARHGEPKWR